MKFSYGYLFLVFISLFFLLTLPMYGVSLVNADSKVRDTTHDGRFSTRCNSWAVDASKEFCEISFYKLIAMPETYNERIVGLTGFLIEDFGKLVLFPSPDRYSAGIAIEGIEITGLIESKAPDTKIVNSPNVSEEIISLARADGAYPIYVVGKFDARYSGDIARLGSIRIHHALLIRNVPKGKSP
jgi:hypothetical protein